MTAREELLEEAASLGINTEWLQEVDATEKQIGGSLNGLRRLQARYPEKFAKVNA